MEFLSTFLVLLASFLSIFLLRSVLKFFSFGSIKLPLPPGSLGWPYIGETFQLYSQNPIPSSIRMRTSSFKYPQFYYFLACFLFLLSIKNSNGSNICIEKERQALLSFKHNISDKNNLLSSWTIVGDDDCCKWAGIRCDNTTGHVIALDLGLNTMCFNRASCSFDPYCQFSPDFEGEITSSLLDLAFLNYLDLSCNRFEKIPSFIGSLENLVNLNLSYNYFLGKVPPHLGNISRLKYLDIDIEPTDVDVQLKVDDSLEWISHLTSLEYLSMEGLNLSSVSDCFESITKLPLLKTLHLSSCNGPNPQSFLHLNSSRFLEDLYLEYSGNITTSLLNLWLDESSKMIELRFFNVELHGMVPGVLNKMHSLEYLELSNNYLEGQDIEDLKFLSHLRKLKTLNLEGNLFSFNFSEINLGSEKVIEELRLEANRIVGSLDFIKKISSIRILDLRYNKFSGSLPDISTLLGLELFDISHNQLVGNLMGSNIGHLSHLETLDASFNFLEEVIYETHLANFSKMKILSLSNNQFQLNLSPQWIPPFQLLYLSLSSCKLGPEFPSWVQTQTKLAFLEISDNGISDFIPQWLFNYTNLWSLNLSQNWLHGTLPNMPIRMSFLDLSSNWLEGPAPTNFSMALFLNLARNKLSGTISFLCSWNFDYIYLSDNHFSGKIPECLGQYVKNSLMVLDLANNNFTGEIPSFIGKLNGISSLHLRNNHFFGELPLSLKKCTSLKILDIGENHLTGGILEWIGSLTQLRILDLHSNKLKGPIPITICQLHSIRILDISLNDLSGTIPTCFSNYNSAMSKISDEWFKPELGYMFVSSHISLFIYIHYDYGLIMWKGKEVEYNKTLKLLKVIDLSCNQLIGKIPEDLTSLHELVSLNLSRNNLTGSIPYKIGQMKLLECMDLSNNQLYGPIPASMVDLSFLAYLDLSNNNLSGCIPLGTQLQSFSEAYQGNPGLHGPPLLTKCRSREHGNAPKLKEIVKTKEDKNWICKFDFYVGMALGFILGFWGTCGTLILKSSWRHAYFQFLEDKKVKLYIVIVVYGTKLKRILGAKWR